MFGFEAFAEAPFGALGSSDMAFVGVNSYWATSYWPTRYWPQYWDRTGSSGLLPRANANQLLPILEAG